MDNADIRQDAKERLNVTTQQPLLATVSRGTKRLTFELLCIQGRSRPFWVYIKDIFLHTNIYMAVSRERHKASAGRPPANSDTEHKGRLTGASSLCTFLSPWFLGRAIRWQAPIFLLFREVFSDGKGEEGICEVWKMIPSSWVNKKCFVARPDSQAVW